MNIDSIKIENFKSLKNIVLNFSNLTLITGINSVGKSSLIESLLLLRGDVIFTNEYIFKDKDMNKEEVFISLNNEIIYKNSKKIKIKNKNINLFSTTFQYLETNRIAPQKMYGISEEDINNNLLGTKGEFTTHYLNFYKNNRISIKKLKHKNAITHRLIENVSLWLGDISNGIEIKTDIYPELNRVRLSYKYSYNKRNSYSPLNVGFGLTFVLPIIVAILKAKAGDLLIIENPESHLHPAGQSKVAELCAIASANGVQIIVETHSDHFLNGIRVATKKGLLIPEQSSVYYFRKDKDELETKIDEIHIDENGGIDNYPKGFFDQFDDDLDELLGL